MFYSTKVRFILLVYVVLAKRSVVEFVRHLLDV